MNQLADELGVPVKEILARLNEQGVIVRSGSVAVPKRVARWLRDFYSTRDQDKPASVSGGRPRLRSRIHRLGERNAGERRLARTCTDWGFRSSVVSRPTRLSGVNETSIRRRFARESMNYWVRPIVGIGRPARGRRRTVGRSRIGRRGIRTMPGRRHRTARIV